MMMDTSEFKQRFETYKKEGIKAVYDCGKILPKYDGGTDDKTYLPEYEYEATVTPQGTSLEKHKRITNEEDWQKYWGNVGAGYVNQAQEAAAPVVLNGMSMLMGNPIGAFAGIGGSIFGSELGAKISPQASAIGGLAGGFLGGVDINDVKNLAQIGRISKSVKPLFGEPSDIAAMQIIQQNLFDNYTKFRAPFKNVRSFPETVGDIVPEAYYAKAFGGRDKLLTDLSTEKQIRLAAYDISQSEPVPFRDSNGARFIHMDDTGPQPVSKAGLVPKDATNSNSPWNSGGTPKIWWAKNEPYYPFVQYRPGGFESVPRTYVSSEKNLVNNNLDGLRNVYTTEDIVPFTSIDYAIQPNMFGSFDLVKFYDKGKSIHINPANKGKFNATKKRTGKTTEQLAHSKNPLTRKRAIFALNSRKFKH